MKKSFLILGTVLIAFSISAFSYVQLSKTDQEVKACSKAVAFSNDLESASDKQADFDLFYRVGNRWSTITKTDLNKLKSIRDILGDEEAFTRDSYRNIRIDVLLNDKNVRDVPTNEVGQTEMLNVDQLKLLQSLDYSSNLRISTLSKKTDLETGLVQEDSALRYITIIPEKEAEFEGGFEAMIEYVKANSKEQAAIIVEDQLQPCKVFFTVTDKGTITNVKLIDTSGYPSIDKKLVKVITKMPRKWDPATNSKGEKVDQELVLFYGKQGC